MAVNYTNSELQLSGTVTLSEWHLAIGGGGLTYNNHNIYQLEANMRLLSGADISGLSSMIIELNTRDIYIDSGVVDSTWRDVIFIESGGRSVADRNVFRTDAYNAIGGGFIHNIEGNPGGSDPRFLTMLKASGLNNVTIFASSRSELDIDGLSLRDSGIYSDVVAKKVRRLIVFGTSTRVRLRRWTQTSSIMTTGGSVAVYGGGSMMVEGGSAEPVGNPSDTNWADNFNGQAGDHWLYLLGTANDRFSTSGIRQRKNQLHVVGGGLQYLSFVGGQDGTVYYFDSRGTTPQKFVPTTSNSEMLNTATSVVLGADENIEVVVQSYLHNNSNSWTKEQLTGQKICYAKYNKVLNVIDVSGSREAVIGSETSYAPVVVFDDSLITEQNKSVVLAYSIIDTAEKLYDRAKAHLIDNYAGEAQPLVTRNSNTINAGSYNITIDPSAAQAFDLSSNTLTIKATTFTGSFVTTGTVTLSNNATVTGSIQDSVGDSQATISMPTGFDTASLHTSETDADAGINAIMTGTTVRYQSSVYGGNTLWIKLTSSIISGNEIIVSQEVPTGAGVYNFIAAAFSESDQIRALQQTANEIKTIAETARDYALAADVQTQG